MGLPIVQLQWTPCWSWRKILLMQLCLYKLHGSYLPPQLLHLCHLLHLILAPGMDPLLKHLIAVPCHFWSSYRCILMSSNHQRLLSPPPYVGAVISLPFLFMSFFHSPGAKALGLAWMSPLCQKFGPFETNCRSDSPKVCLDHLFLLAFTTHQIWF